jgi:predicted MFS family arabinose efflux permease
LRWLPTGLLVPVLVLLLLERGLSLAQLGVVFAGQGLVVLVLELPTGGLADAIGRRTVLLVATVFEVAAFVLLIGARSVPLLVLAAGLMGVYRALESGPLDSWYVDTAQAVDPDADIERGLSRAGIITGLAIGVGALLSSALVAFNPLPAVDPLVTPVIAALVLLGIEWIAIATLMTEVRQQWSLGASRRAVSEVPTIVATAVGTVRRSTALVALVLVEFLWGLGIHSVETFTPARLGVVLDSADRAAAILGPANTVAWLVAAGGAALVPFLARRLSPARAGAGLRIAQGITVLGIAFAVGPIGVVIAYVLAIGINGASDPIHQGMLHRAVVDSRSRATVVSVNSLTGQTGAMLGGIALGMLADATSLTVAIVAGAIILSAAAPLYLIAGRGLEQQVREQSSNAPAG